MLQRWLTSVRPQLERLPVAAKVRAVLSSQRGAFRRTQAEENARQARQERREERYATIQRLRQEGYNIGQIARLLHLHPQTVRNSFYATACPQYKHGQRKSILDPFLLYLERRHAEGCENALLLWREIHQQGFPGTERQVLRWLHLRRTQTAPSTQTVITRFHLLRSLSLQSIYRRQDRWHGFWFRIRSSNPSSSGFSVGICCKTRRSKMPIV